MPTPQAPASATASRYAPSACRRSMLGLPPTRSRPAMKRALIVAALLAGCAVGPPPPPPPPAADNAAGWYRAAAAAGAGVLAIDPAQSLIAVTVRRGGALARL